MCTITNTRNQGKLEVVKTLSPTDEPGLFDLYNEDSSNAVVGGKDEAPHNGTTGEKALAPGPYTVGEPSDVVTEFVKYLSSISLNDGATSSGDRSFAVDVDSLDDIVCTITNMSIMSVL